VVDSLRHGFTARDAAHKAHSGEAHRFDNTHAHPLGASCHGRGSNLSYLVKDPVRSMSRISRTGHSRAVVPNTEKRLWPAETRVRPPPSHTAPLMDP
jgi:hypothetical protein